MKLFAAMRGEVGDAIEIIIKWGLQNTDCMGFGGLERKIMGFLNLILF